MGSFAIRWNILTCIARLARWVECSLVSTKATNVPPTGADGGILAFREEKSRVRDK